MKKDVQVKIKMNVSLSDVEVSEDGKEINLEEVAHKIQEYIADGGKFDFDWEVIEEETT